MVRADNRAGQAGGDEPREGPQGQAGVPQGEDQAQQGLQPGGDQRPGHIAPHAHTGQGDQNQRQGQLHAAPQQGDGGHRSLATHPV